MSKEWKKDELLTSEAFNNIEEALTEINPEYVPHEWKAGDMISAERLNIIEEAIANASGDTTTFTLHIVKGDGMFSIDFYGCMGTEDGSMTDDVISETTDITILPYNGKAFVYVRGTPSTLGDVVSVDIDGDIEALQGDGGYLMTGNATIELTAETPQS